MAGVLLRQNLQIQIFLDYTNFLLVDYITKLTVRLLTLRASQIHHLNSFLTHFLSHGITVATLDTPTSGLSGFSVPGAVIGPQSSCI